MTPREQFEKERDELAVDYSRKYGLTTCAPSVLLGYQSGYRACLDSTVVRELVEALESMGGCLCQPVNRICDKHKALSNLNSIKGEMK